MCLSGKNFRLLTQYKPLAIRNVWLVCKSTIFALFQRCARNNSLHKLKKNSQNHSYLHTLVSQNSNRSFFHCKRVEMETWYGTWTINTNNNKICNKKTKKKYREKKIIKIIKEEDQMEFHQRNSFFLYVREILIRVQ